MHPVDRRRIDNHILALADSLDEEGLRAYIDNINSLNEMPNGDSRYMTYHRDAAVAALEIKKHRDVNADMPLVINGREHASCVETLRWMARMRDVDNYCFATITHTAKEVGEEKGWTPGQEAGSGEQRVFNTVMAVRNSPITTILERMADIAGEIPKDIHAVRKGR